MRSKHRSASALTAAIVVALLATACSSDSNSSDSAANEAAAPPATSQAPETAASGDLRAEVALSENTLVGFLTVDTPQPSSLIVTVTGSEREFVILSPESDTRHELPVAGLRAEHDYQIVVDDGVESVELSLRTGALPSDFPAFDVLSSEPDQMSPGFTLFNLLDNTEPDRETPPSDGYLLAIDAEGEVVWYHRTDHAIGDVRQEPDGTILHEYNDTGARRIDLYGTTLEEWAGEIITGPYKLDAFDRQVVGDEAVVVATDSMHHEVTPLDNGNFVAISTERLTVDGFPTDGLCDEPDGIDGSYELISDVIIEFTPDGEVVNRYPLADYFDPVDNEHDSNVCGLPLGTVFPNWLYWGQGFTDSKDWTHANAVVPDPTGEFLTISVRHLDAVIQIERATGDLVWRLGPGGDFTIDDEADFNYHQHAPEWQDDGTLLMYDNGNGRPTDGAPYSRAVQFRLDPDAGTAEVVWEQIAEIDGEPAFASFVGDADRLENGNVLVTNGGLDPEISNGISAQIVEVIPDTNETVFELRLAVPDEHWIVYRSERIASFYPS